jgi:hypothetical protein
VFFDWHMEHEHGIDTPERLRLVYARPAVEREWADQKSLTALVLWRAACDHGVLVDDVELASLPRYYSYTTAGAPVLHDGLVPPAAPNTLTGGPRPELFRQVAAILSTHALVDSAGGYPVGPATTVGFRIRELRSTPGWIEGDWPENLKLARTYRETAWQKRVDGTWPVTPQDLQAARQASPADPAYDYPAAPAGPDGYRLWLQHAHHLLAVGTTLKAVASTLPRTADGYIAPLAMVLDGHGAACHDLRESAHDIEQLWAAEPVQPTDHLSSWDLAHVPNSLREQTEETTYLIQELRVWLETLLMSETGQQG